MRINPGLALTPVSDAIWYALEAHNWTLVEIGHLTNVVGTPSVTVIAKYEHVSGHALTLASAAPAGRLVADLDGTPLSRTNELWHIVTGRRLDGPAREGYRPAWTAGDIVVDITTGALVVVHSRRWTLRLGWLFYCVPIDAGARGYELEDAQLVPPTPEQDERASEVLAEREADMPHLRR